jgi:hypothetical protein
MGEIFIFRIFLKNPVLMICAASLQSRYYSPYSWSSEHELRPEFITLRLRRMACLPRMWLTVMASVLQGQRSLSDSFFTELVAKFTNGVKG